MSGTKRIPVARRPMEQVTPRAVALFVAMGKLRCTCPPPQQTRSPCLGCERWWGLHNELHDELRCKPWERPAVGRQGVNRADSTCSNENIAARMAMLRKAARRRTNPDSDSPSPPRVARLVERSPS